MPSRAKSRKSTADWKEVMHETDASLEAEDKDADLLKCCSPRGCKSPKKLTSSNASDCAVKVVCNNEDCSYSWMHKDCFEGMHHVIVHGTAIPLL